MKNTKTKFTEGEESMIRSCFSYSMLDIENQYLKPIADRVGKRVLVAHIEELKRKYTVITNVYTDSEGGTYNKMVEKNI